ncbi:MAG: CBS domain-containing protein [Nitrospirae bacterium]|nr:CBS domain-containing protein [Nitrospirota bacterium]
MRPILINEVMIPKPVTITPDQTIGRAMELMARYDFRRLPVVKEGKLVGIITDRDVRQLAGRPTLKLPKTAQDDAYLSLPVEEAMTLNVITIRDNQPVQEAIQQMLKHKISGLPAVDRQGQLTGMLSIQDVLKYCLDLLDREADR